MASVKFPNTLISHQLVASILQKSSYHMNMGSHTTEFDLTQVFINWKKKNSRHKRWHISYSFMLKSKSPHFTHALSKLLFCTFESSKVPVTQPRVQHNVRTHLYEWMCLWWFTGNVHHLCLDIIISLLCLIHSPAFALLGGVWNACLSPLCCRGGKNSRRQ